MADVIQPNQPLTPTEPEKPEEQPREAFDSEPSPEALSPVQGTTNPLPETDQTPPIPPVLPAAETQHTEPKRRGPKTWLIVILIIIIAAASTAAALYITKSDDTQTASSISNAKKDISHLSYALPDGNLSEFYPLGVSATSVQLNSQIFEGLVRYDKQTKIVPLLATKWSNPDTSTWVFELRKDVKFHNGRPMTAKDVKHSIDYAIANQDNENMNFFLVSSIKQVDIVNDYEVKVTTDGPDPILLNKLAYVYIVDAQSEPSDPNGGTGPYIVKPDTTPTETNIELVAWDDYYGGHIYTKSLTIDIIPNADDMVAAINSGKYDLVGSLEPDELSKVSSYEPVEGQGLSIGFIGLNTTRPDSPLATKEARQAIAYALDIPKILKAGNLAGEPATQLVPPKIPGYDSSIEKRTYDPTKAKELLAGVKNLSTPLTLSYGGGDDNKAHMTEIANELKAVGFNVTLSEEPDISTLAGKAFSGEVDMFYIVYDSPTLDGYDVFSSILQGNEIYKNTAIDDQINQTNSTLDPAERLALLKKISKEVAEGMPVIPVYVPIDIYALRKPYYVQPDIPGSQAGIYFWQTYQK